jgi:hypothetical protein
MRVLPAIVIETTKTLFENRLLQLISAKLPTPSCEAAARTRITFDSMPTPPIDLDGAPDFDSWAEENYPGVPLEFEIKTALFVARKADGTEIFIAVHIPADIELASNGVLKTKIRESLGIAIVGDLDKKTALAKLNGYLRPLFGAFRAEDEDSLSETGEQESFAATVLRAHIDKPNLEFGQLNPWTFLMLSTYSREADWQQAGVTELPIIHLVDSGLAKREGFSTTNAGSRYVSMTIANTTRAFEFLEFGLKQAFGDDSKLYAVCDGLEKVKQL